jgi:hypothetical protein
MYANRRSSERRACRSFAKIQFATGGLPRDCMISDVSDGGVKIIAEYPEIPSEFTVIFSEGRPRQCRLAWRIGCELGAQFVDERARLRRYGTARAGRKCLARA